MKKLTILAVLLAATTLASAADTTSALLKGVYKKYATSVAMGRLEIKNEAGTTAQTGTAVCIRKDGLYLVSGLNGSFNIENLDNCKLIFPGQNRKTITASFIGFDPLTGLGFLQASKAEAHTPTPVPFQAKSAATVGDKVLSLGLSTTDAAITPTLGVAYIASVHRVPNLQIHVTGGTLTSAGSVVFNTSGQAIGLVLSQPWTPHLMPNRNGGTANMPLRNQEATSNFTPVEEFVFALAAPPKGMRRMPWIGVGSYSVVHEDYAPKGKKLTSPAVKLDSVIPGDPADTAGIRNGEMIVSLNGKVLPTFANNALLTRWLVHQIGRAGSSKISLGILSTAGVRRTVQLQPVPIRKLPAEAVKVYNKVLGLLAREKVFLDSFLDKSPTAKIPGLLVIGVGRGTPCALAGLRVGDVIVGIGTKPVSSADAAKTLMNAAQKASKPVRFTVKRGTNTEIITVRFPS